jgi:hypothetical protein
MAWLKRLNFRHVYAAFFEDKFEPVLNAAVEMGTFGSEYLYVFPGFDVFVFRQTLMLKAGKYQIVVPYGIDALLSN